MAKKRISRKRQRALKRRRRRRIIFGLEILLLLVLIGVLYVVTKLDKIQSEDIDNENIVTNDVVNDRTEKYRTLALFGVDSRDGSLGAGNRTDTIMVVSINNQTGDIKLASIYRDTYMNQADTAGTYDKANAAYARGGPEQAINMLNINLDLQIKDYVTVDFNALSNTIDLLGGIEIEMSAEEVFWTNGYTAETREVTGIATEYLPEGEGGTFLLTGVQATSYCRIRKTAGSDYKRTERQRLVIEKMFEKTVNSGLGTLNKIIDDVFPQISTSLSVGDMVSLGSAVFNYNLAGQTGFPFYLDTAIISGSGDCVIAQGMTVNVEELHKFLYEDEEYEPSAQLRELNDIIINNTGIYEYVKDNEEE